jgi:hypothetical protein
MAPVRADRDVPRNERSGLRVLATLSIIAVCVTIGGLAFDLYVIATHQLTAVHRAWDIASLLLFGLGAYAGMTHYRTASRQIAALRSPMDSH